MATTLLQVMEGIETRLATITGLRVSEIKPDQVNPPQALVGVPPVGDYRATQGRGVWVVEPTVTVLVSGAVDRVGQRLLAEFAAPTGARSIRAAVEADRSLGGLVDDCMVRGFRPLGREEVGVIGYYGGEFVLMVAVQGGD